MKFFAVIFLAAIIAHVSANILKVKLGSLQSGPGQKLEYNPPVTNASGEAAGPVKFLLEPCRIKFIGDATCFMQCFAMGHPGGACDDGDCLCVEFGEEVVPGHDVTETRRMD